MNGLDGWVGCVGGWRRAREDEEWNCGAEEGDGNKRSKGGACRAKIQSFKAEESRRLKLQSGAASGKAEHAEHEIEHEVEQTR